MNYLKISFIALALQANYAFAQTQQTITFGVVPQQSATKLLSIWSPILKTVSSMSGYKVIFKTSKDISTFEESLLKGHYDMAYMNPYHYTEFHKNPGYIAFAKAANSKIKGIIVIKKGSPINSIKDLNQQSIAFPSPNAFAASMLIQSELRSNNIDYTPKYVLSHDSVYLNVAKGIYSAGGGIQRTFKATSPELQNQLVVLEETKGYTPHAFAYHPRLNQDVIIKIADSFTKLHKSKSGEQLLKKLHISSIESATDQNWNDIRVLNIQVPTK